MIYQTQFPEISELYKNGCLFASLAMIAELITRNDITPLMFTRVYDELNEKKVISKDLYDWKEGAFIHDHEAVINAFLQELKSDKKVRYVMRYYMPYMHLTSFGTDNIGKCDFMILQVQTINGGHFRMLDYDPWELGTETKYIKSIRGYQVI